MISGREKMTRTGNRACAMKSVTFSLMVKFFLEIYNILCMDYAVDIMFL